jgi:hypothetical protein
MTFKCKERKKKSRSGRVSRTEVATVKRRHLKLPVAMQHLVSCWNCKLATLLKKHKFQTRRTKHGFNNLIVFGV